jgi:predicted Zn-dependent protease
MAEADRIRIEIAFRSGQTLGVNVNAEVLDEIDRALLKGEPESISFDAEDGRYTVVIRMVAFVKRHLRESRVGFGAGG